MTTTTLIGMTEHRGTAWQYRAATAHGANPNFYRGPIPVEDVVNRLFSWDLVEGDYSSTYITPDGVDTIRAANRLSVVRPRGTYGPGDQGEVLGTFKRGYKIHQYRDWLVDTTSDLVDTSTSDLVIEGAGIGRGGAIAWVQIGLPDTMEVHGYPFRVHLLAATSANGSLSTGYTAGAQAIACDNAIRAARIDRDSRTVKVRHTANSLSRIVEVRDALKLIYKEADALSAEIDTLVQTAVSEAQWAAFLEAHSPASGKDGRARTFAEQQQSELDNLWRTDPRVKPWRNTAWGVVAAVNTHFHHLDRVTGGEAARGERNMMRLIRGDIARRDVETLRELEPILAR